MSLGYIDLIMNKINKYLKLENVYILVALFVLILFSYITSKTPLAGDDWGYAINGMKGDPIKTAIGFYNGWSGRFFSELWGFVVAPRKWLWNILNPLLFTSIFVGIYKLIDVKKHHALIPIVILAVMLSVDDHLRMETYTWIMGSTYVVPLALSIWYFVIANRMFEKDEISALVFIVSNIFLFIIGLMMENIAATMVGGIVILCMYSFLKKKNVFKYLLVNLAVSSIAFMIMRSSPGSASRLLLDHPDFATMSFIEKIINNYPIFIKMSFINNNYMIAIMSLIMISALVFSDNKIIIKLPLIAVFLLSIVTVFGFVIKIEWLTDGYSLYSMIFWPIYVICSFVTIYLTIDDTFQKEKTIFLLVIAGASVVAMLFSPIFGARSCIYIVYYIIVVISLELDNISFRFKPWAIFLIVIFMAIICDRSLEYINKYRLVGLKQYERLETINYYKDHPEDEEVWIKRFPIYTVHGADIEPDDTYHLQVFKEYYNLPQDQNKIIFYVESN